MSELKFVEGGWYQEKLETIHKMGEQNTAGYFKCVCCGLDWFPDGRACDPVSASDVVRRVMPPVDYVPVKKWIWGRFIGNVKVVTESPQEMPPEEIAYWMKVDGSETEE